MNKKAEELGLENTHFVTPHGLDSDGHYTTAFELAVIADYGLNIAKFKEIVGTKNYTVNINGNYKNLSNTNELLGNLNGVYGVKTGFTNGANRCLVTACKRNNLDIICVVLGADTKKFRTQDSIKLIEYTFKNYEMVDMQKLISQKFEKYKLEYTNKVLIEKGKSESVEINLAEINTKTIPLNKDEKDKIELIIHCEEKICAPVDKNQVVGNMQVLVNGNLLEEINIVTKEAVEKKTVSDYFIQLLSKFNKCFTI